MTFKLNTHRSWITPLVIGTFALSGTTGVLMFFHLDTGLNKAAHEWLSWALLAGVVLHVLLNASAFKRYLGQNTARWVLGASALVLGMSFLPLGGGDAPPFVQPVKSLAAAPLPVLATVAGVDMPELQRRLTANHVVATGDTQTVAELAGPNFKAQMRLLNAILAPTPTQRQ